jgi:hypothetical protein
MVEFSKVISLILDGPASPSALRHRRPSQETAMLNLNVMSWPFGLFTAGSLSPDAAAGRSVELDEARPAR